MSRRPAANRRDEAEASGAGLRLRRHARAFADARTRLAQAKWATSATLCVLAVSLLLPLLLGLSLTNALRFAGTLESSREIGAFLAIDRDAAAAESLAETLRQRPDVAAVQVRTPAEGLAEFRQMSDLAGALDLLDGNPLPFVLVVSPRDGPGASANALAQALGAEPGVDSVQYDAAWRARLDAWLAFASRAVLLVAALLLAGALLVVGNTVRLDLAGRREEIALLQQLGADDADIRRPLLYLGLLYGLGAALLALAGVAAAALLLDAPLARLADAYGSGFSLRGPGFTGALGVLAAGAFTGWLGARWAAGHYLRMTRAPES